MSQANTRIILLALILGLSACSHNPFSKTSKLQKALDEQSYDRAISLYQDLDEEQQASFDLKAIETDRNSFISQSLKSARTSIGKKNWLDAQIELESALNKTPSSTKLQTELAVLNQRIAKMQLQSLSQLQLIAARQYMERQPAQLKWQKLSAEPVPYENPVFSTLKGRQELADSLGQYGTELLTKNDNKQAKAYLEAAQSLHPDTKWEKALASIDNKKAKQAQQAKAQKKQIRALAFKDLQNTFASQLKKEHFKSAQKTLTHAKKVSETSTEKQWVKSQSKQLQKQIQSKVDEALKKGQFHYSKGRVDEAISIWKEGLRLDPSNRELKDSLERAERFKQTYESLK